MTAKEFIFSGEQRLIGAYGYMDGEIITQLGFLYLDMACLGSHSYRESEDGPSPLKSSQDRSAYILKVELILGALSLVIFLLLVCIAWVCCHEKKKADRAKDTQIIDEGSIVKELVGNDDENIDFAPVGKAFEDKVLGKN